MKPTEENFEMNGECERYTDHYLHCELCKNICKGQVLCDRCTYNNDNTDTTTEAYTYRMNHDFILSKKIRKSLWLTYLIRKRFKED